MPPRLVALLGALLEAPRHLALDGVYVARAVRLQIDGEELGGAGLCMNICRARDARLQDADHGLRGIWFPLGEHWRRRERLELP